MKIRMGCWGSAVAGIQWSSEFGARRRAFFTSVTES